MTRKSYVSSVERRLFLDKKTKARIIEGIQTEIQIAQDNGQALDAVIAHMGSPKELATEYNQSYKGTSEYRVQRRIFVVKWIALAALIVAVVSIGISQIGATVFLSGDNIAAVGGVDGPQNITITKTPISPLYYFNLVGKIFPFAIVAFVLCAAYWIISLLKRNKNAE